MVRSLSLLVLGSAVYGFSIGSAHSWLYASRDLVKLPLLLGVTGLVCGLAYYVTGRSLVDGLGFARVQRLTWHLFRDLAVLLASLAPANFFLAMILLHTDDSRLGEYSLFLGLNVFYIGFSGALALIRQASSLTESLTISRRRAWALVFSWLFLTLFVGGQVAFYLRPFFGLPASRGVNPPFLVGSEADVRGATNFYEAVIQVFEGPPLPESWGG